MIHKYIRTCQKYQIMNLQKPNYMNLHQEITQTPQDHISVDLIGPYNTTSQDNTYTLTVVRYLTAYLMTTPIPDKKTTSVAIHLFSEIMLKFRFPQILHSNNGTEFKSKFIEHLLQHLSIRKPYISPQHPQANRKLESLFIYLLLFYSSIVLIEFYTMLRYAYLLQCFAKYCYISFDYWY